MWQAGCMIILEVIEQNSKAYRHIKEKKKKENQGRTQQNRASVPLKKKNHFFSCIFQFILVDIKNYCLLKISRKLLAEK